MMTGVITTKYDESFVKVPSKNLSDAMVEAFKGGIKS